MNFYKEIAIDRLDEIRKGVLERTPDLLLESSNLTYIDNNRKIFMEIDALREFLESKKLVSNIVEIAINITKPHQSGSYHMDSGPYHHSINIPITDCVDSWINFFETTKEPYSVSVDNHGKSHVFYRFNAEDCKLIHRVETTKPYILGVKTPHRVENLSDNTRIMLLIRIWPGEHLNKILK